MKKPSSLSIEFLERVASVLKLLAHPQRLKIVELLETAGAAPVHELEERLGLAQAATSQHLGQMKRVGLITAERRGKEVWYRLADPRCAAILDCIRSKSQGDRS